MRVCHASVAVPVLDAFGMNAVSLLSHDNLSASKYFDLCIDKF